MKKQLALGIIVSCCLFSRISAQSVTFDFDSAPAHAPLPIDLTVGGITAHFSANPAYYNYSIQPANSLGFTPVGFSGLCIYPNTIYLCDLLVSFNTALSDISIMYAPEEYATDSSCTVRITAYYGPKFVGTNTNTIDPPGTWPTGVLSLTTTEPFTSVVIHYDKAPITGGDYGPIFMADNLVVTPWTAPYARLDSFTKMNNGNMLLRGVSVPFGTVTIESTNSLAQAFTFLTTVGVASDGSFQFEDAAAWLFTARFLSRDLSVAAAALLPQKTPLFCQSPRGWFPEKRPY